MCCKNNNKSHLNQTLEELKFEKGIWTAALEGDIDKIKKFSQRDVNKPDNYGFTALHYAARNGHYNICKYLIENRCNVNATTNSTKSTPLHRAAYVGNVEIIKLLISNGADLTIEDDCGKTCLDKAIENNQEDVIAILKSYFT